MYKKKKKRTCWVCNKSKYVNEKNFKGRSAKCNLCKIKNADRVISAGWIYIISNESFPGIYKIGLSANPESRVKNYQMYNPLHRYIMEFKVKTKDSRGTEGIIHNHFSDKRVFGEWFSINLDEAITYISSL